MPRTKSKPPKMKSSTAKTQKTLAVADLSQRLVGYLNSISATLRYHRNHFPTAYANQLALPLEELAKAELIAVKIGHTMVDLTLKLDEGKSVTTLVAAAAQLARIEDERSEPASAPGPATVEQQESAQQAHTDEHEWHGKGDAEGPYASDCKCRGTDAQAICAKAGCSFCVVWEGHT